MNNTLNAILQLRRDTETNYNVVRDQFVPLNGEVCIVDTSLYGTRFKIGDGQTTFANLSFVDTDNNIIQLGYYFNQKFYIDSTYTTECETSTKHLYVDKNTSKLYVYNGSKFISAEDNLPTATDTIAGVMKLYQIFGNNTDGSISQKVLTDGISEIKFDVIDTDDDGLKDCLVLDLPIG